jgi:hypothetical protein
MKARLAIPAQLERVEADLGAGASNQRAACRPVWRPRHARLLDRRGGTRNAAQPHDAASTADSHAPATSAAALGPAGPVTGSPIAAAAAALAPRDAGWLDTASRREIRAALQQRDRRATARPARAARLRASRRAPAQARASAPP